LRDVVTTFEYRFPDGTPRHTLSSDPCISRRRRSNKQHLVVSDPSDRFKRSELAQADAMLPFVMRY
jgi:hypothetical protein